MTSPTPKTPKQPEKGAPKGPGADKCCVTHSPAETPNHGQCDLLKGHMGSHHCSNCGTWY